MLSTLSLYQPLQAPTLSDLPKHIDQMLKWQGEKCAMAAYMIYRICEYSHRHNRVHMLMNIEVTQQQASTKQPLQKKSQRYSLLSALCETLKRNSGSTDIDKEGVQYACLALNILSIPAENKPIMGASEDVLEVLRGVFSDRSTCKEASYVCCICLLNLSLYEPNRRDILRITSPDQYGRRRSNISPIHDPYSLLRILEHHIKADVLSRDAFGKANTTSIHQWACALLQTLTRFQENANLVVQTDIARGLLDNIVATPLLPCLWTSPDSLESTSLSVLLNLAEWPASRASVLGNGSQNVSRHGSCRHGSSSTNTDNSAHYNAIDIIQPIVWEDNVEGLKAIMTCALLGAPWTALCPDGGVRARTALLGLLTNILNGRGKEAQYTYDTFRLSTAIKAFRNLANAAVLSDKDEQVMTNLVVVAIPLALATCLQIVTDFLVVSAHALTEHVPSAETPVSLMAMSAEYAVSAEVAVEVLHVMLPALLSRSPSHVPSGNTVQGIAVCGMICHTMRDYVNCLQFASSKNVAVVTHALTVAHKFELAARMMPPPCNLETVLELWKPNRTIQDMQALLHVPPPDRNVLVDRTGPMERVTGPG